MRIQDARRLLFSKLNATIHNPQEKLIKIRHYDEFALKTFINGLPYHMQLVVRLREPDSLELALAYVKEKENFIYFKTNRNESFNTLSYKPRPLFNQVCRTINPNTVASATDATFSRRPVNAPFNNEPPYHFRFNNPGLPVNNTRSNVNTFKNNNQQHFNTRPTWQQYNRLPKSKEQVPY